MNFITNRLKEKFQDKTIAFIKLFLEFDNLDDFKSDLQIKRQELSLLMKKVDVRINIIKFDKEDWINDPEPNQEDYKLSSKPGTREIMSKLFDYIEITKDITYLVKLKKVLDKVSLKLKVTIFETMTDEESEEYFESKFKSDNTQQFENGFAINEFFN